MCIQEKTVTIVASVYNEQDNIINFYQSLTKALEAVELNWEVLFVNDGSVDQSTAILNSLAREYHNVKVIHFSKNFGHEAAMIAGVDYAQGDYVICMDSDLQHPTDQIPAMLESLTKGKDIVLMIRKQTEGQGFLKSFCSKLFYKLLNTVAGRDVLKESASDFFGMTREIAGILRTEYRHNKRFLRGYIQDMGYDCECISYEANKRHAGKSKYHLKGLLRLTFTAFASFTMAPLGLGIVVGGVIGIATLVLGILAFVYTVKGECNPYLWLAALICGLSTLELLVIGIIGCYLSVVLHETRKRPIYLVKSTVGIEPSE